MAATAESAAPAERSAPAPAETKTRLTKKLPTFRASFTKHMDCLRAYAVLSKSGAEPVHYIKISDMIKLHEANVSSMNPFFVESGFIEKQAGGYMPHAAVIEYNRQHQWNPENAAHKLAPVILAAWYGQALSQRLQFRPMTDDEAVEMLAGECNAGPESRGQLKMLIELCESAGILRRDGGQLFVLKAEAQREVPPIPAARVTPESFPAQAGSAQPHTPAMFGAPTAGAINLQFSINVDMADMKGWSADRIGALFAGIAQVLAAQKGD